MKKGKEIKGLVEGLKDLLEEVDYGTTDTNSTEDFFADDYEGDSIEDSSEDPFDDYSEEDYEMEDERKLIEVVFLGNDEFLIRTQNGQESAKQDRVGTIQLLRELDVMDSAGNTWEPDNVVDFAEGDGSVEVYISDESMEDLQNWF